MKNILLFLAAFLLVLALLINNGILITLQSDSDAASLGVILLLISLVFTIIGIRKHGEVWSKRKRVIVQTVGAISIVLIYLITSALIIYSRSQNSPDENINPGIADDNELINARNEFISGLNRTLSTVSEQSNGFYTIIASYNDNNITLSYKINIENDISINDDPIDALVNEAIKAYKDNGMINILKSLKFNTL